MKHGGIVDRLSRTLQYELRTVLGYPYTKYMFSRYLKEAFGDRYKTQSPGPVPPPELITTEALMYKDELKARAKPVTGQLNQQDRAQLEHDGALTLDGKHPRASYS